MAGDDHLEGGNEGARKVDRMGHIGRLKAIWIILFYVEQQRMATATEVPLLFRH